MSGSPTGRASYTVACTCGVQLTLDARGFGVPKACRGCGGLVTVAWGRDPNSRKTVPVAMTRPPKAKPGDRDYIGTCPCGYHRPVSAAEHDKKPRCARCGKVMNITVAVGQGPKSRPSAPLLPLYLRAKDPLQTVVKKNARFFDCVCGLRLTIRPGTEGQKIRCPDCDRAHVIESKEETSTSRPRQTAVPPAAAPRSSPKQRSAAPPPEAAPSPPPPPASTRPLSLGEFLCECGEIQPPRTSRTGRDFVCKKCGRKGRVETDKDPKTGLPIMRPVFTSGPTAAPPRSVPRPAAAPPEAPEPAPVPPGTVSFEELSPMEVSFAEGGSGGGDAPPSIDADAQVVPCECGAEILLSANDVGHTIQCPACADKMLVEGTTDARTGALSIKLRLVGALDDPDWKLEEFQ